MFILLNTEGSYFFYPVGVKTGHAVQSLGRPVSIKLSFIRKLYKFDSDKKHFGQPVPICTLGVLYFVKLRA